MCLLSFSQPRTQFSTLEERCHSPFHRPPRAWPLNLKEIQLHKNSFSFYGEGKRIQKDFLIPRGAQPPINQLVMKVSFPTRRRQRENRTHQVLNPPRLNACKNFYEEGRDGVSWEEKTLAALLTHLRLFIQYALEHTRNIPVSTIYRTLFYIKHNCCYNNCRWES